MNRMQVRGRTVYSGHLVRIGDKGYILGGILRDTSSSPTSYLISVYPPRGEFYQKFFRYTPAHGGARRKTRRHRK